MMPDLFENETAGNERTVFGPEWKIPLTIPGTKTGVETGELKSGLPLDVVIMAGGKGERLMPLTRSIPKPLLPVGGKPIVEYSLIRLCRAGVKEFTFCVNHQGEKVREYFGDGKDRKINIGYIFESEPLGTIGGAALKDDYKYEDILVINGDLLTTINFERLYLKFLDDKADITVATIPYRIKLPYGIFEIDGDDEIKSIQEKPTYTYFINAGIYLMKQHVLKHIPADIRFDAIQLLNEAIGKGLSVTTFPVLDYWIDVGQQEDYEKAQKDIDFLDI